MVGSHADDHDIREYSTWVSCPLIFFDNVVVRLKLYCGDCMKTIGYIGELLCFDINIVFQNEGEKGTRLSAGKIADPLPPKVPDYPEEPNPDQTMDMTHIV